MRKLIILLVIITTALSFLLTSCKKEKISDTRSYGKTFVRVQEVDVDGNTQNSSVVTTYVNY